MTTVRSHPEGRPASLLRCAPERFVNRDDAAGLLGRGQVFDPVGQGRGRAVDRQELATGRKIEDLLGIDAAALELVQLLGQLDRVLVAVADVVDDPGLPDLEGFAVAGVDRPGQEAVVCRLTIIRRWPARARSSGLMPRAARQTARSARSSGVSTSS
jgi:hypothetical protein